MNQLLLSVGLINFGLLLAGRGGKVSAVLLLIVVVVVFITTVIKILRWPN